MKTRDREGSEQAQGICEYEATSERRNEERAGRSEMGRRGPHFLGELTEYVVRGLEASFGVESRGA